MRGSGIRPSLAVFILQLHADDRTIVVPVEALQLFADLAVKALDVRQIGGVVGAHFRFREHPIWKPAIARFAVDPRADAHDHVHPTLSAQLHKMPEVSLPGPIELAFDLFVMNPENVRGDYLHSA